MSNPHQQYPPQQPWGPPPQQPRRRSTSKIVGLGCLGIIGLFVVIAIIAAAVGGGSSNKSSKDSSPSVQATTSAPKTHKPAKQPAAEASKSSKPTTHKPAAKPKPKPDVVTFKVWGTAPAGALGPLDITYGSDSDNRKGTFSNGAFTATLPLNDDAMYYDVTAQLQGSGDIQCSVTVGGKTKKGHASGSYNICDAQLSSGLFGGWE